MLKFAKKVINSLRKTVSAVLDKASATVVSVQCLAGLYALFNTTIMPTVTKKVTDLFNYKGK